MNRQVVCPLLVVLTLVITFSLIVCLGCLLSPAIFCAITTTECKSGVIIIVVVIIVIIILVVLCVDSLVKYWLFGIS